MAEHESPRSCGCDKGAHWICEMHRRDPLDEATMDMQRAIAAFHDVIRAAKQDGTEARRTEIYYRSVNLLGFVQAMALDARRDLDALKDLPL